MSRDVPEAPECAACDLYPQAIAKLSDFARANWYIGERTPDVYADGSFDIKLNVSVSKEDREREIENINALYAQANASSDACTISDCGCKIFARVVASAHRLIVRGEKEAGTL